MEIHLETIKVPKPEHIKGREVLLSRRRHAKPHPFALVKLSAEGGANPCRVVR